MPRMIATHEPELIPVSQEPLTIADRFRANVQRLRLKQNLSYSGLAERVTELGLETNENAMRALLNSQSYPSTKWIELMARAFGCSEKEITASVIKN